jgi:hypothetical protein
VPGHQVGSFASETQQTEHVTSARPMPIWAVGNSLLTLRIDAVQDAALKVGRRQHGLGSALFSQHMVIELHNPTVHRALNLHAQKVFLIDPLHSRFTQRRRGGEAIESVVSITA